MAIPSRIGSISFGKIGGTPAAGLTYSHTTTSDTTVLIVILGIKADADQFITDVLFDGVSMDLIRESASSNTGGDKYTAIYGIVGKANVTGDVEIAISEGVVDVSSAAVNIQDTSTSSVVDATRGLAFEQSHIGTPTQAFRSTGKSGRFLVVVPCWRGDDTDPFSYSDSFTRIDLDSGSGADEVISATADSNATVLGWAELNTGLPSAVTVSTDSSVSDENACVLFELIPDGDFLGVGPGQTKTTERLANAAATFSDVDVSHVIDPQTTLVVVDVITAGDETAQNDTDFTVVWDTAGVNEALTRIRLPTRASKTGNDPHIQTWAILSPTIKSALMEFKLSAGTYGNCVIHITNYIGTTEDSLGAAIAFVDDDVNLADSSTCDIASGGTSGNLLHAVCAFKGTDTGPLDITTSGWGSISTNYIDPNPETASWASHLVEREAPSAVTWDAQGIDPDENNMGVMFEIVPAATSPVNITDVNTTETWNDGDTGLVITGTGFV